MLGWVFEGHCPEAPQALSLRFPPTCLPLGLVRRTMTIPPRHYLRELSGPPMDPDPDGTRAAATAAANAQENALGKAAQCWRDLEEKTGYHTYKDYINENLKDWPQHNDLSRLLSFHPHKPFKGRCYIFDATTSKRFVQTFKHWDLFDLPVCTRILQNILAPPRETTIKYVFVEPLQGQYISPVLVDALGLSPRINPRFFEACTIRMAADELSPVFGRTGKHEALPTWLAPNPWVLNHLTDSRP